MSARRVCDPFMRCTRALASGVHGTRNHMKHMSRSRERERPRSAVGCRYNPREGEEAFRVQKRCARAHVAFKLLALRAGSVMRSHRTYLCGAWHVHARVPVMYTRECVVVCVTYDESACNIYSIHPY